MSPDEPKTGQGRVFIPGTMERSIGRGVVFRPIRSWHSLTFAGENLEIQERGEDRSGCVRRGILISEPKAINVATHRPTLTDDILSDEKRVEKLGRRVESYCYPPGSVTHRKYWNVNTKIELSVFLSYPHPHGLTISKRYQWELYPSPDGDVERFDEEEAMERRVLEILGDPLESRRVPP